MIPPEKCRHRKNWDGLLPLERRGDEFLLADEAILFCHVCGGRLDDSPHKVDRSGVVCACVRVRADDPTSTLEPNRHGEFEWVVDSQRWIVYFCPWCGTRLPESRRGEAFTHPTNEEIARLRGLVSGARTVQEVLDRLGAPDRRIGPFHVELPGGRQRVSVLGYTKLSPTADLQVKETENGSVSISFSGKYIGVPPDRP